MLDQKEFTLPTELWVNIFLWLDLATIINCTQVSKHFRQLCKSQEVRNALLGFYFHLNADSVKDAIAILDLKRSDDIAKAVNQVKQYSQKIKQFLNLVNNQYSNAKNYLCTDKDITTLLENIWARNLQNVPKLANQRYLNFLFDKIIPLAKTVNDQLKFAIYCHQPLLVIEPLLNKLENPDSATMQSNLYFTLKLAAAADHFIALPPILNLISKDFIYTNLISTAIEFAARYGNNEIVKYLLYYGKDHLFRGCLPHTLYWLVCDLDTKFIKFILDHFSDLFDASQLVRALLRACEAGHLQLVKYLIKVNPSIVNLIEETSALICAASSGQCKIVRYLLQNGANVNARGEVYGPASKKSALYAAVQANEKHIVGLLLKYGATDDVYLTKFKENALTTAISCGYKKIVDMLIKFFPNNVKENDSVLINALRDGNLAIIEKVISIIGNDNLDYENPIRHCHRYNPPLKYAYKESPKIIHAVFRGIVKYRINHADNIIACDDKSIDLLAKLLRFIYECHDIIHNTYNPAKHHIQLRFALHSPRIHFNRYALHAAQALEALLFENQTETSLDAFLLLLKGQHPVLTEIYQHFIINKPTEDHLISLRNLFN